MSKPDMHVNEALREAVKVYKNGDEAIVTVPLGTNDYGMRKGDYIKSMSGRTKMVSCVFSPKIWMMANNLAKIY